MPEDILETRAERQEAAKPFLKALEKYAPEPVTLFGISQHTLELLDFRQDVLERIETIKTPGGFCSEAEMEALADAEAELAACNLELAKLAGQEVAKVDHCANLLRMCDRMIEHRTEERDRQNKAKKRWEAIKEGVENVVMEALTLTGGTRFDSPTNTLRMQRNSSPRVDIVNPQAVQDRFVKVTLEVTVDHWKQMREAIPELVQWCVEKERTFVTGAIARVLKAATAAEAAERAKDPVGQRSLTDRLKEIERVKGAELKWGKHLRVE